MTAITLPANTFVCECDTPERRAYRTTHHPTRPGRQIEHEYALYCGACRDGAERMGFHPAPLFATWSCHDGTDTAVYAAGLADLGDEVWTTEASALRWALEIATGRVFCMADCTVDSVDNWRTPCAS